MSKKSNPAIIGAFVIGAVALLALGVALFGGAELFKKRLNYVAYFDEQTKGLRVGSNVILNGVRVGYVSEIALLIDEERYETLTRVTLEILPDTYIPVRDGVPVADDLRDAIPHQELIEQAGLRAQLEIESFVTGQLVVRLDLRPETPIRLAGMESDHPEIPTIRSDIQELLARMQQWLANIRDNVDVDALAEGVTNALNGIAALRDRGLQLLRALVIQELELALDRHAAGEPAYSGMVLLHRAARAAAGRRFRAGRGRRGARRLRSGGSTPGRGA